MLFRLAHLAVTNTFASLRLLPMGNRDKDIRRGRLGEEDDVARTVGEV
ncbi:hypothetical protein ACIBEJ_25275 [Nonomuraea sp. NPDC050790]